MQKITKAQITKIHIAKSQLGLSRENYEAVLSSFVIPGGGVAVSSKDLNQAQAEVLINKFKEMGWLEKRGKRTLKYEEFYNRAGDYASPKQMRLINACWNSSTAVREKTDIAMNRFIKNITGKDSIEWIRKNDVQKIINAIKRLK